MGKRSYENYINNNKAKLHGIVSREPRLAG